ncbi:MAG: XRE family transcriptional regulator [Lachnospiraceae bacterium]|nr:XRE family transcriptional regulator [Lachnospiraceae bacterium]
MNSLETTIKSMLIQKYGSLKKFTESADMPWTTLDSVLKRGINNSNIANVIKICEGLNIDCESLYYGKIVSKSSITSSTLAAHRDSDDELTPEEQHKMEEYKRLLIRARDSKK